MTNQLLGLDGPEKSLHRIIGDGVDGQRMELPFKVGFKEAAQLFLLGKLQDFLQQTTADLILQENQEGAEKAETRSLTKLHKRRSKGKPHPLPHKKPLPQLLPAIS